MKIGKSFKNVAKAFLNPVGAGIEKLTGISQGNQLKIGAGIGAGLLGGRALGMFGTPGGSSRPFGPMTKAQADSIDAGQLTRGANGMFSSFNPWSLLAPVIGAGADMWSASKLAGGQQEANVTNIETAREQMAFQKMMSDTSHQREVADLRAAGLNPVLSANSGASTPVGSSNTVENDQPDFRSIVPKGLDSALNLMQMKKEFEKADSSIYLNVAAADREEANARVAKQTARQVGAEADVTEMARDFAKKNPKQFGAGQWIKWMSPFATSASSLMRAGH